MKNKIGYIILIIIIIILGILLFKGNKDTKECPKCVDNYITNTYKYICTLNETVEDSELYDAVMKKEVLTYNIEGLVKTHTIGTEYKFKDEETFNRTFNSEVAKIRSYEKTGELTLYDKESVDLSTESLWVMDMVRDRMENGYICVRESISDN